MTDQHWFIPKSHGYGATPANWKGWAATFGYVASVISITLPLMIWPVGSPTEPTLGHVLLWAALVASLTAAFVKLSKLKTDGEWRWRWGNERSAAGK